MTLPTPTEWSSRRCFRSFCDLAFLMTDHCQIEEIPMFAQLMTSSPAGTLSASLGDTAPYFDLGPASENESCVKQMRLFARLSGLPFWCLASSAEGQQIVASTADSLAMIPFAHIEAFQSARGPHLVTTESAPSPSTRAVSCRANRRRRSRMRRGRGRGEG